MDPVDVVMPLMPDPITGDRGGSGVAVRSTARSLPGQKWSRTRSGSKRRMRMRKRKQQQLEPKSHQVIKYLPSCTKPARARAADALQRCAILGKE
jgi:hypothetical protein